MSNKNIDFFHNMNYWFRCVSAHETTWRILAFPTHYRILAVEKLCFHLLNQDIHIHDEFEPLESILQCTSVSVSQFLG